MLERRSYRGEPRLFAALAFTPDQDDTVSRSSPSRRWRSPLFLLIAAAALLFAFLTL